MKKENLVCITEAREEVKLLETLKQNTENLCALQKPNMKYIEQLQEKENCHEIMQQECEEVKECGSKSQEPSSVYDKLNAWLEVYLMYIEKLEEKNEYLERLNVEDMNSGRDTNLKYIDELGTNNVSLQMQIHSLKEKNSVYVEQVKEKGSYIEALKQQIEDINYVNKTNLICIKQLHDHNKFVSSSNMKRNQRVRNMEFWQNKWYAVTHTSQLN